MRNIKKNLVLLREINIADWISLSALFPITFGYYFILNNQPYQSIIVISIAFLLDVLDGFVARRLKIASDFGKQLDTLIDTLNYLSFTAFFILLYLNFNNLLIITTVLIMLSAGILRLARYNIIGLIEDNQKQYYIGMPVPFVQLIIIILFLSTKFVSEKIIYLTPLAIVMASFFMISTIKFKKSTNYLFWLILIVLIVCLILMNPQK